MTCSYTLCCFVSTIGLHAFQKASFKCGRCAHVQAQNRDDFLRIGAWPATPKKLDCLVSIQLLKRFQRHKFYGAPTSVDAFLKEIHEEGRDEYGVEVRYFNFCACYLSDLTKGIPFSKVLLKGQYHDNRLRVDTISRVWDFGNTTRNGKRSV